MGKDIFYSMKGFGKKEIKGIVWGRQMAIHAIGNKPMGVVNMSGCLPGINRILNFMTGCTEPGS